MTDKFEESMKVIDEVQERLAQHPLYSKKIRSVSLHNDKTEQEIHIDIRTNLSEQEDCRGLGYILQEIKEKYRNKMDICFHQYSYENFN